MKFSKKRRDKKVISLDRDNFATLISFSKGRSVYEFIYSVDYVRALQMGGQIVEIVIIPVNQPKPPSIFSLNALSNKPSAVLLAQNIQQITQVKKDTKNSNINSQFASVISDFTTSVSNTSPLSPTVSKKFNLSLASTINQNSQIEPIMQTTTFPSASVNNSLNSLAIDSILQDGEDPSNIQQSFTIGTSQSIQGIISQAQAPLILKNSAMKIVQKTLSNAAITNSNQASITTVVPVFSQNNTNFATVKKIITFESGKLQDAGEFIVKFNLIGLNGLMVESAQRKVDHVQNVRIIQTPIIPPTITSITLPARNLLTITQNDPLATSVDIYRKQIKRTQQIEDQNYVFVSNVPVSKAGGPIPFEDLIGNASTIVYRIIPKGEQGQVGPAYTNKVVKAFNFGLPRERTARLLYAGIVAQSDPQGIRVEVVGLAPGVSSIKLLARDRTRGENQFRIVPSFIGKNLTVVVNDTNQSYVFLDSVARSGSVIEYAVMLLFSNGDEEISTTREIFKNVPFSFGIVDTFLTQPRILQSQNGIDVQFKISSRINSSKISVLKSLLEQQGQSDLFSSELENEKNSLNNLIAHQIRRIDLSTGETDFFRTFTGTVFSDEANRTIDSIGPLLPGRIYRYIVSSLLRAPETLFENNIQTITNSAGIVVNVLPLKFKHPIVKELGNLVSPTSLAHNHSESQFEFGNVGNFVSQDVSIDISRPKAFNAKVFRFNKDTNIVRWNLTGEKTLIDHFLIIVDRFGDEEIVGRVHTIFNSNVIEFIDKKTPKEPGSYRYKIIPVQKDYTHAPATITQEII